MRFSFSKKSVQFFLEIVFFCSKVFFEEKGKNLAIIFLSACPLKCIRSVDWSVFDVAFFYSICCLMTLFFQYCTWAIYLGIMRVTCDGKIGCSLLNSLNCIEWEFYFFYFFFFRGWTYSNNFHNNTSIRTLKIQNISYWISDLVSNVECLSISIASIALVIILNLNWQQVVVVVDLQNCPGS